MPLFSPQYGSFTYSMESGVFVSEVTSDILVTPRQSITPGRAGAFTAGGLLAPRKITISGLLIALSSADLRDPWEAFKGAHAPGLPQVLYLYLDRFCNAEVMGISNTKFDAMANRQMPFSVDFLASDPWIYDTTVNTTTGLAAGGTVTAGGTAPGAPLWTLVVSGIGGTVIIANVTTGESFTLTPDATGTYLIDSQAETVTKSSVDKSAAANGTYPTLAVGVNTITLTATGSVTISALQCDAAARYF